MAEPKQLLEILGTVLTAPRFTGVIGGILERILAGDKRERLGRINIAAEISLAQHEAYSAIAEVAHKENRTLSVEEFLLATQQVTIVTLRLIREASNLNNSSSSDASLEGMQSFDVEPALPWTARKLEMVEHWIHEGELSLRQFFATCYTASREGAGAASFYGAEVQYYPGMSYEQIRNAWYVAAASQPELLEKPSVPPKNLVGAVPPIKAV